MRTQSRLYYIGVCMYGRVHTFLLVCTVHTQLHTDGLCSPWRTSADDEIYVTQTLADPCRLLQTLMARGSLYTTKTVNQAYLCWAAQDPRHYSHDLCRVPTFSANAKVVCLLCKKMESKGMQWMVDEHVEHQTFMQKAGACVPLDQTCNWCFNCNYHCSLTLTRCFSYLILNLS